VAIDVTQSLPWLLVAVAREHLVFRRRIQFVQTLRTRPTSVWRCRLAGRDFILAETGVGGAMVGQTLDWLLERGTPRHAVFAGFAGALVDDLRVGDSVRSTGVVDPAGGLHVSDLALSLPGREGRLMTSDHLVDSPEAKKALALKYDALAVDMESSHFATWCARRAVAWACVRVVSDDVRTPVARDVFELLEDGRVSAWGVTKALFRRPALVRELLHLGRATAKAAHTIADVLAVAARHE
jgi:adenosylhomocysteine nucleosidase